MSCASLTHALTDPAVVHNLANRHFNVLAEEMRDTNETYKEYFRSRQWSFFLLEFYIAASLAHGGVKEPSVQIQHFNPERLLSSFKKARIVYHTQLLWLCAFLMEIAGTRIRSAVPNTHLVLNCAEL